MTSLVEWAGFLASGWGLPFTLYVVVQSIAAAKLRGTGRVISVIPALPMTVVLVLTVIAYLQNSNLWPILLILASPLAIGFVGVVWLMYRRRANEEAA